MTGTTHGIVRGIDVNVFVSDATVPEEQWRIVHFDHAICCDMEKPRGQGYAMVRTPNARWAKVHKGIIDASWRYLDADDYSL